MNTYTVRNTFDGNDSFEIEAKNLIDAALDTCNELGKDISADSQEYRAMIAAPDLLAVAIAAVEWAKAVPAPYRDWPFIAEARAAIAKATGEQ